MTQTSAVINMLSQCVRELLSHSESCCKLVVCHIVGIRLALLGVGLST